MFIPFPLATDQKSVRLFSLDTGAMLDSLASTYPYEGLVRQISFEPDWEEGIPRRLVVSHANQMTSFSYEASSHKSSS